MESPRSVSSKRSVIAIALMIIGLFACGRQGYEPQQTPCDNVTCSDHGRCVVLDNEAVCVCDGGYLPEGLECVEETIENPCLGVTCSGYGTCAVREGEPWCVCAEGYHNEGRTNCVADERPCEGADGEPCDDGQFCTTDDRCIGGVCTGFPNDCDDGNSCTVDICNEVDDVCVNTAAPDNTPCDDGQYCTLSEFCTGGICADGSPRNCSDGNPCTTDSCDEDGDACASAPSGDGAPCDDGAYCSVGETCIAGACGGGSPVDCSDGNACTSNLCDESIDTCANPPVVDGTPCDDGEYCTIADACSGGFCTGAANPCSDGNPCTNDVCDEVDDGCVSTPVTDGTPCDDQAYCSVGEVCTGGECRDGLLRNCSDGSPCTTDSCDEDNDTCVNTPTSEGAPCDDGAYCSEGEVCTVGVCGGGIMRDCSDSDVCTADVCDEALDACIHVPEGANGTPCDDGQYCSLGDACSGGICMGGGPRDCSDGDICTVDSCDESGGQCLNDAAAADGNACDDGAFCTVSEVCNAGNCQDGVARDCSDGNDCSVDSCDEDLDQCINDTVAADGNNCNDGAYCTVGETCSGGFCSGGSARDCTDADACTADSCDEVNDECDNDPVTDGTACNDGLYCNVAEICTGGVCGGGIARNCSDGNQCTADSCDDGNDECVNDAAGADGAACDDGFFCMVGETCNGGVCGSGSPRDCSDPNGCTVDSCDEAGDTCENDAAAMDGVPCDDGNFCLVGELCNAGVCGGGSVRLCDDGNQCTENNCNEGSDLCENPDRADGFACEAGQFCTSGDTCQAGVCQEGAIDPCAGDPCANLCDEINDLCGGCAPAGTQCMNPVQEATCDGACNTLQLIICEYGCNLVRDECNECAPSTVECKGDAEFLCNAEFVCDADGLLQSKTCCTTNRCTCDASMCLEDLCAAAPDLSGGGNLVGTTCNDDDNIPGDCLPGGAACRDVSSGGAPDEMFQFTLDDGTGDSAFFDVELDSSLSTLDTTLRTSTVCGSETTQVPNADVCGLPGTTPEIACSQEVGPETMELCGLPEGTYYGAVDGPSGDCDDFDLSLTVNQVSLETGTAAGNITLGGTFTGNTCGMNDDYLFPDGILWGTGGCGDCVDLGGGTHDCPSCGVAAATDCTIGPNSTHDRCTYSGDGSPDAVFYLALEYQSGVDISTLGSDFDTVLYIMQTGTSGASPPGPRRVCNDDCWTPDGASHIQTSLSPGLYYVYLDGAGGDCGNYVLDVTVSPAATCGNLSCQVPYETCRSCPLDCPCPNCGDGAIDSGEGEECDDNNAIDDDGCTNCGVDDGYRCTGEPSVCNPIFLVDEVSNCACTIPDCNRGGGCGGACNTSNYGTRTDVIAVGPACTVVDINVDMNISHVWRGDISIELSSPGGTTVSLKQNDIGDGTADIVGNFDQSLPVDGPGSLSDFFGGQGNGNWTLTLHDWYLCDEGTLNSWALHLTCE
ncbi:MAG: proprotein convertase P-domain-containing protein [Deltaproteobacteria bacterium]|nr:proprotein convertase P-domain-containing protein [Deltaproteobacteria bacterium]